MDKDTGPRERVVDIAQARAALPALYQSAVVVEIVPFPNIFALRAWLHDHKEDFPPHRYSYRKAGPRAADLRFFTQEEVLRMRNMLFREIGESSHDKRKATMAAKRPRNPIDAIIARAMAHCVLLALLLGGCVSNAELVKAMASSTATVCVHITSIYGSVRIWRTNMEDGTVTCNPDGLSVKSDATKPQ